MRLAALCLLLLCGCSTTPGCYVGVAIFPPGPFVHCGVDLGKPEPAQETKPEDNAG